MPLPLAWEQSSCRRTRASGDWWHLHLNQWRKLNADTHKSRNRCLPLYGLLKSSKTISLARRFSSRLTTSLLCHYSTPNTLTVCPQEFRLRMAQFSYTVEHVPGKQLYTADTLSRVPMATIQMIASCNRNYTQCPVSASLTATTSAVQRLQQCNTGKWSCLLRADQVLPRRMATQAETEILLGSLFLDRQHNLHLLVQQSPLLLTPALPHQNKRLLIFWGVPDQELTLKSILQTDSIMHGDVAYCAYCIIV